MPVDPSVFNNIKTYQDYKNQQDAVDLQRAQVGAALQSASIDTLTKKNVLKGQYLSAAAGTGDQGTWDATRQKLGGLGIDVSDVPQDVNGGKKYADSLRLAQTPYGTLFNGALNYGKTMGDLPPGAANIPGFGNATSTRPPPTQTQTVTPNAGSSQDISVVQPNAANVASDPTLANAATPARGVIDPATTNGITLPGSNTSAYALPTSTKTATPTPISLPPKDPLETIEAYKLRPDVIAAQEKAKKVGENQASSQKNAVASDEANQLVTKNLDAIISMAPSLPQSKYFVPASAQASINKNFSNDTTMANNFDTFKTINESQTINAIRELAQTGQIRMSRTLEGIINRGYLIDPDATAAGKIQQANAIKVELQNAATAANNVNARTNGGDIQPYASPLVVPQIDPRSKDGMQTLSNARSAVKANPGAIDAINARLKAAGLPAVGN